MRKIFILILIMAAFVLVFSKSEEQASQMAKDPILIAIIWFGGIYVVMSYLCRDKSPKKKCEN